MKRQIKIFLLEDNPYDFELIKRELLRSYLDFQLFQIQNKAEYIRKLKDEKPDLILSDYNLPDYNGLDALNEAKKMHPGVPFILITEFIGEEKAIEILREGAWDYVFKEKLHKLKTTIINCLHYADESRLRREAETELYRYSQEIHALTDNSFDIIERFDRNLKRIFINESVTKLTGFPKNFYLGKSYKDSLLTDKEIVNKITELMNAAFKQGNEQELEFHINSVIGIKFYRTRIIPEFDEKGSAANLLVISKDITEHKKLIHTISESANEKEILFSEMINGLNTIFSLSDQILIDEEKFLDNIETKEKIKNLRSKLKLISMIYGILFREKNLININIREFLNNYINESYKEFNIDKNKIRLVNNSANTILNLKTIIPFSILLNELLSRSIRYTSESESYCEIGINLNKRNKRVELEIYNSGTLMDKKAKFVKPEENEDALSKTLIDLFRKQLNGDIEIIQKQGLRYRFSFDELN